MQYFYDSYFNTNKDRFLKRDIFYIPRLIKDKLFTNLKEKEINHLFNFKNLCLFF
jgi:hypothetical protein